MTAYVAKVVAMLHNTSGAIIVKQIYKCWFEIWFEYSPYVVPIYIFFFFCWKKFVFKTFLNLFLHFWGSKKKNCGNLRQASCRESYFSSFSVFRLQVAFLLDFIRFFQHLPLFHEHFSNWYHLSWFFFLMIFFSHYFFLIDR